jgi:hypothetical protein
MTLVPAYGRDYTSAKAVKDDWFAGKDFLVADVSSPYDGKPINRGQTFGRTVLIRYNRLRRIVSVN